MSVENSVFLRRERLPTLSQWCDAIHRAGFEMEMDVDPDIQTLEGFLPCTYKGAPAGFEFYTEELDTGGLSADELEQIGDRLFLVTLVTHADFGQYMTSMIASAVLCSISDGLLAEGGEPPFISATEAVIWAQRCEPEIARMMGNPVLR